MTPPVGNILNITSVLAGKKRGNRQESSGAARAARMR